MTIRILMEKIYISLCLTTITTYSLAMINNQKSTDKLQMIDIYNEKKLNKFIVKTSAKNKNNNITINKIEFKLEKLQQEINTKKQLALITIKNQHNISDSIWDFCADAAKKLDNFEEENKHIGLPYCNHDKNMAPDILLMLKKNLLDNGMNPQRFNIETEQTIFYTANYPILKCNFKNNNPNIYEVEHGRLGINQQQIKDCSLSTKEALCMLLVNGISKNTRYYNFFLVFISTMHTFSHIDKIDITKTEIDNCRDLISNLSALSFTLNNKHKLPIIKTYYNECPHLTFTIDDDIMLSKIERLHKSFEWLQKYMPYFIEKPIELKTNNNDDNNTIQSAK